VNIAGRNINRKTALNGSSSNEKAQTTHLQDTNDMETRQERASEKKVVARKNVEREKKFFLCGIF
jgi:hypothetical protein